MKAYYCPALKEYVKETDIKFIKRNKEVIRGITYDWAGEMEIDLTNFKEDNKDE